MRKFFFLASILFFLPVAANAHCGIKFYSDGRCAVCLGKNHQQMGTTTTSKSCADGNRACSGGDGTIYCESGKIIPGSVKSVETPKYLEDLEDDR